MEITPATTTAQLQQTAEQGIEALLYLLHRNPAKDNGIKNTPTRAIKALLELGTPTEKRPHQLLNTRFNTNPNRHTTNTTNPITVGPIPFTSLCEHHLLPFTGHAWITYKPHGPAVGLSKLARLVNYYAKQPQMQERLTEQIAQDIRHHLSHDYAITITATHTCLTLRGPQATGTTMTTTARSGHYKHHQPPGHPA